LGDDAEAASTREPDTAYRNAAERRLKDSHAAERNKPPPF
jgi:hypothetical protein